MADNSRHSNTGGLRISWRSESKLRLHSDAGTPSRGDKTHLLVRDAFSGRCQIEEFVQAVQCGPTNSGNLAPSRFSGTVAFFTARLVNPTPSRLSS